MRRAPSITPSESAWQSDSPAVADVGEQDLIARITTRLPIAPDWVLVGPGDDAAVLRPERNTLEVITTDACVEGVHFDRSFVPPDAIGHRALAVNLSDLAAMGAAPRLAHAVARAACRAAGRRLRRASSTGMLALARASTAPWWAATCRGRPVRSSST